MNNSNSCSQYQAVSECKADDTLAAIAAVTAARNSCTQTNGGLKVALNCAFRNRKSWKLPVTLLQATSNTLDLKKTALNSTFKPPFVWVHELRAAVTAAIAASVSSA